ncbi:TetR family transcriptional regulator [Streptomyces somaliensis]|uniref:TetR/AcrR family transcriptional regulator n=1 Tax=Streptomyces somaliensis TaxID=78355 RepID=UPI0020CE7417|nr:TetR family transcriptional regulator [Streptomyces somaliensis]MCP9944872.1 TetR family transcriptional regulator [Streptomyces somaliensis]MCP9961900.1 TetR family transcriptional regulator [Streptomyces somaliensis]MCP9974724.1 TetR family transcriptional regulator [Streptomyces somaliensis]
MKERKAAAKAPKSERTRALILGTALRLFEERGYDRTTMRAVAQEAGVSVGSAYYYFASKEHLVQGFYDRIAAEHETAVGPVLAGDGDLAARLRDTLLTWLDVAEPYHRFAAQFFKNAADPRSPLSPFSPESADARRAVVSVHERVLRGSGTRTAPELDEVLPQLLWLMHMGLVLFWVYDRSEGAERSRRLVERTAPLVAQAVALSRFRVLRPLVRQARDVAVEFLPGAGEAPGRGASADGAPRAPGGGGPPGGAPRGPVTAS